MMEKKVAVVTGGARGIGRCIVERLLADGFRVAFNDINEASIAETEAALGSDVKGHVCDVANADSVKEFFKWLMETFGRLDVLVNNAGITRDGLLLRMKPEQWDLVIAINLRGSFLCAQAAIRLLMKNDDGGRIINMASVVGVSGNAGQANYSASKAGLIGLTKSLARELASRRILVNAIAPGFIDTEMTAVLPDEVKEAARKEIPLGEFGKPAHVAAMCSFLAGPDSAYSTGQVFHVDGGMVM
jgi:3-oxoacyl-[acyl-carrier protein] reductase